MGRLVRVGITGQGGFMGSHLYNFLGTKLENVKRINFKRSYLGITCLIQISTRDNDYIIDPFPIWNDLYILN